MDTPKFQFGQEVWFAHTVPVEKHIPCPDCCGKKFVTVTFGDGETVTIDCATCENRSYDYTYSCGFLVVHTQKIDVIKLPIQGIKKDDSGYRYSLPAGCGSWCPTENEIFDNQRDAELRAAEIAVEQEAEELKRKTQKERKDRTWAWNASYHRRQLKEAQRQLEYHTAKLEVAKRLAKESRISEASK